MRGSKEENFEFLRRVPKVERVNAEEGISPSTILALDIFLGERRQIPGGYINGVREFGQTNDVQITVYPPAQCCKRQGWMVQTNVEDECFAVVSKTVFADVPPIGRGTRTQDHLEMPTPFISLSMICSSTNSEFPFCPTCMSLKTIQVGRRWLVNANSM